MENIIQQISIGEFNIEFLHKKRKNKSKFSSVFYIESYNNLKISVKMPFFESSSIEAKSIKILTAEFGEDIQLQMEDESGTLMLEDWLIRKFVLRVRANLFWT